MVDKKGKLFGRINLIDFIIILVIVLAALFLVLRMNGVVGAPEPELSPVRMKIVASEVPDYVIDYIVEGEEVWDFTEDVVMGTVESYYTDLPQGYSYDVDGQMQQMMRDGYKFVELTFSTEAEVTEHGVRLGNRIYGVGHSLTIFAGKAKMFGRISHIEILEG